MKRTSRRSHERSRMTFLRRTRQEEDKGEYIMAKTNSQYDVFISYRRKSGVDDARLLQQALKARGYEVFFDYDSLRVGKFDEKIFEAIKEAAVFILMLTEGALDGCANEEDWVRAEIECAIDNRRQIIPVLPSNHKLSFPDNLPPELSVIPLLQVSELNKASLFDESVDKIVQNSFPDYLIKRSVDGNKSTEPTDDGTPVVLPFGEKLIQHLDQWLPWEYFRAVAGLEFSGKDGNVSLVAHAVGSPWGVFLIGFNDSISECTSDTEVKIPTDEQMQACAAVTAKKCGLREHLVRYLFAVPEDLLRERANSFPEWVVSAVGAVDDLKLRMNETRTVDWANKHRDITKCLEKLPMSHSGREANIIKHFNARTVDEAEDGAALLAWAEDPSEALLDAAEKACLFLRENDRRGVAEGVLSWFRVMADRGNVIAMDHYGWLLDGGDEERVRWFRKAVNRGGAHAQNSLGYCLQVGRGVPKDRVEALRWFRASAAKGNRFGQCSLADLMGPHADPAFLPQDWNEAFRLYRLSANQGWHWAQYHLGECYEKGLGTPKNLLEARRWYGEAAKNLNEDAQAALKRIESMLQ